MTRNPSPHTLRQAALRSLMTPVTLKLARLLQQAAFSMVEPGYTFEEGFEPAPLYNAQALALYTNYNLLEKSADTLLEMVTIIAKEHRDGNRA